MQKSLIATVGDDEYSTARKEVLTHMCSRPMQVRAQITATFMTFFKILLFMLTEELDTLSHCIIEEKCHILTKMFSSRLSMNLFTV